MNGRSGYRGLGQGFGRPAPALTKIFKEALRNDPRRFTEALQPKQEALVDKYYQKIMSMHKDGQEPSEKEVKSCLRELLHASEAAEGEDPSEIDQ